MPNHDGRMRGAFPEFTAQKMAVESKNANHDFARAVPPDRDEVGAAHGDDEGGFSGGAADEIVRIEECAGEQAAAGVETDGLATVQMSGEHEVEVAMAGGFPDAGIVGAEDVHVGRGRRGRCRGSGDGESTGAVDKEGGGVLDPTGTGCGGRGADHFLTHGDIVIAGDGKDGGDGEELLYQIAEVGELGRMVDEIATEEDEVGKGAARGVDDLRGEVRGPAAAEVDVADVGDPAGRRMGRDDFLTHVERLVLAELQALTDRFQEDR